MELEIESRHVDMTPRWKTEIEARMGDLQRGHEDLLHGRVTLTKNPHHKKLDNVAEALIVVSLPERHTLTARKEDKTFEEAIRHAFDAVAIELRKYREKRAHTEMRLPPVPPHRGVISKLFPREHYGFILKEGEARCIFMHMPFRDCPLSNWRTEWKSSITTSRGTKVPRRRSSHSRP